MRKLTLIHTVAIGLIASSCGGAGNPAGDPGADGASASRPPAQSSQPAGVSGAATERDTGGPDIGGLQLGMTPEEVRVAMQAYDPGIKIQDTHQQFEYAALGKRYKTDSFLIATHGMLPAGAGTLAAGYTYPPDSPRVVAITRIHRQNINPLTQADYGAALIEKYGSPAEDTNNGKSGSLAERTLKWKLDGSGETGCVNGAAVADSTLNRFVKDGRKMAADAVTPDYAAQCDGVFEYTLRGDPVTNASGALADIAAQAGSEFQARSWVQQQANEKSQPGSEAPRL